MGGVRNPSGQSDLNTSNNPQQAAAQASKIGVVLPPKLTSPPFAAGFENLTGQPLNNFLAQTRNDPEGAAVAALSTAMAPSDAQKFMGAASDGVSKLLAKGYSLANATGTTYSGGGGGRGGGGGSPEEDAMAQMLGGLMGKLGAAQGQEQENPYGMTKVIGFTGKKLENTGISLDRTENLFEKVSIRYSKIERGML